MARLLPAFDPWVNGMGRREPMIDAERVGRVYRQQGWVSPVILVNGSDRRPLEPQAHGPTTGRRTRAVRAVARWASGQLAAKTRRLAEFLDCELSA